MVYTLQFFATLLKDFDKKLAVIAFYKLPHTVKFELGDFTEFFYKGHVSWLRSTMSFVVF